MEGKLIKVENGYVLMVNNIMYATDNDKLSLKNCQAIANGYDLNELAREACDITDPLRLDSQKYKQDPYFKIGFNKGFQKALEILGDKKFSLEDMKKVYLNSSKYEWFGDCIKSLQQNEWDVEVEMECREVKQCECSSNENCLNPQPKLDADGCLILKRK